MDNVYEIYNRLLVYKLKYVDVSCTSCVTASVVILLALVYYLRKNRSILPGPKGVPYLGIYPFLKDEDCHLQLTEYTKKYGDVFSFTFTGQLFIHLGSIKAMREFHVNKSDCFADRFSTFNILTYILQDGVTMVNGEPWRILRKFFIQKFKDYGLYSIRENLAGPVYDSLTTTVEVLKERSDVPFNVVDLLMERCAVTLKKILFGDHGVSDDLLYKMNSAYSAALECMSGVKLLLVGPFGKFLFHTLPQLRNGLKMHEVIRDMLHKVTEKMESNMDEINTTCVIEDFIKERKDRKKRGDPTWRYFSDKALVASLAQFVGDGIQGVATFIGLFLNALIEHPEEQDKIYSELMEVVGPSRQPVFEDKTKLPYTNAFINEVIRTSCFFPLFPSLACTKETTYKGYRIPKGSISLLNFWSANHDPTTFEYPDKFDPSRYLPTSGKPRPELPILFGVGKRACSGEAFVMLQAFLFLITIVQNFKIIPPEDPAKNTALFLMSGNLELSLQTRSEK